MLNPRAKAPRGRWRGKGHGVLGLVLLLNVSGALVIALVLLFAEKWKLFATLMSFLGVMLVCSLLYLTGHILICTTLFHGVGMVGIIALMAFTGGVKSVVLPVIPVCVTSCYAILPKHGEQIGTGLACAFILAYCLLLLVPERWNEMPEKYVDTLRVILLVYSVVCSVLVSIHSRNRSRLKKKEALNAAILAAERAEHTKNALIANISHELRTPINAALGAAELITLEPNNSEEYADIIRKACNSLLIVINDVLVYSSLEKQTLTIEQAPVNLEQMLWDVLRVMMPLVSANLNLETAVSPEASALLRRYELTGDIVRVQQIIANLVNNAIKFTPQGQVLVMLQEGRPDAEESRMEKIMRDENQPLVGLNKRSMTSLAPSRVWLTFLVKDTGIGIARKKLEHIFDAFTQADEGISRMYGGTGLGLSISRKLARAMGGELTVESVPEEGSTFKVLLPFHATLRNANCSSPHLLSNSALHVSRSSLGNLPDSPTMVTRIRSKIIMNSPTTPDLCFRSVNGPPPQTNAPPLLRILTTSSDPLPLSTFDRRQSHEASQSSSFLASLAGNVPSASQSTTGCPISASNTAGPLQQSTTEKSTEKVAEVTNADVSTKGADALVKSVPRQLPKLLGLVLLVDDTPINLKIVGRLLERLGMTVITATNGLEAVEKVKERGNEIALVLMDVQMPICDGLTATRNIRALGEESKYSYLAQLPIIALTANAMDSNREDTAKAGMTGFLAKPVDLGILETTITPILKASNPNAVIHVSDMASPKGVSKPLSAIQAKSPLVTSKSLSASFPRTSPLLPSKRSPTVSSVPVPPSPFLASLERKTSSDSLTPPAHTVIRRLSRKALIILAEENYRASRSTLQRMGYQVLVATKSSESVDFAMKHGAAAIALLTSIDVANVIRLIREASEAPEFRFLRDFPIIQLGKDSPEGDKPEQGVLGFLPYPLSSNALEEMLISLLPSRLAVQM